MSCTFELFNFQIMALFRQSGASLTYSIKRLQFGTYQSSVPCNIQIWYQKDNLHLTNCILIWSYHRTSIYIMLHQQGKLPFHS